MHPQTTKDITQYQFQNIKTLIQLPVGEMEDEWVAFNIFEIFEFTKLFAKILLSECKCVKMTAGVGFEYIWVTPDNKHLNLTSCEYIQKVLDFVADMLADTHIFPVAPAAPFGKNFKQYASQIIRRLLRVYIHAFLEHEEILERYIIKEHFNTCFMIVLHLGRNFKLLQEMEFEPIKTYAEMWVQ